LVYATSLLKNLPAAWHWIHAYECTKDGHGAFQELHVHYLCASTVDKLNDETKHILSSTFYTREGRHFIFETYVQHQKGTHVKLQKIEKQGYSMLDEWEKVRFLINGIKNDKSSAAP
jgi:hypothetical protein